MTSQSIYAFIAARDRLPTNEQLRELQLERYQRMMQTPRNDKHKSFLRKEIKQLKK